MTEIIAKTRNRVARSGFKVETARPGAELGRVANLDDARRCHGAIVDQIVDGFLTCDRPSQRVIDDIRTTGAGQQLWKSVLAKEPIGDDAPESLRALFDRLETVPDWVDWDQLRRGAIAYWRPGPLVPFVFLTAAIVGGDRSYGISRPQVFTGRFEKMAYTRAAETFRWLMAASTPDGMRRGADGFDLTAKVRMLHSNIRIGCGSNPAWRWDDWGTPICDSDEIYSMTYNFTTVMLDGYRKLGIEFTEQEREDIYALWSYISYVIGVPEAVLPFDEEYCRTFNAAWQSLDPGPDDECRKQIHALIELATPEVPQEGQNLDEVFPALLSRILPPLRIRAMMYGLVRYLLGDEISDQVDIPDTAWKKVGYLMRSVVVVHERLRRMFPRRFSDERRVTSTIAMFSSVVGARGSESVLAPTAEVLESIRSMHGTK